MACTTILVGKNASYDGSTMIARNDDSGAGHYMPKKFLCQSFYGVFSFLNRSFNNIYYDLSFIGQPYRKTL